MKSAAFRMICRLLVASLMLMSLTTARAGMIGVDQLAGAGADRAAVTSLLTRSDVASQLQARGIDQQAAQERIAAMTDQEVQALKGQIEALPAGASSDGAWVAAVIIIALVVWYVWFR
jgi:hypothetical protein